MIFLAEDEDNLRETLVWAFEKEGFTIKAFADGVSALNAVLQKSSEQPAVLILDVGLPRMNGFDVCKKIRATDSHIPILFLTSRDEEIDRVLGLELGADDYLCKPFSLRELFLRVRVLWRRAWNQEKVLEKTSSTQKQSLLISGDIELDTDAWIVRYQGQERSVSMTEYRILLDLLSHEGMIRSREQLQQAAYEGTVWLSARTMDAHITRIRKKLGIDPVSGPLNTVHGFGYRWIQA